MISLSLVACNDDGGTTDAGRDAATDSSGDIGAVEAGGGDAARDQGPLDRGGPGDLHLADVPPADAATPDLPTPDLAAPDLAAPDQTPTPQTPWAINLTNTSQNEYARGIVADDKGNLHIAGAFHGVTTVGTIPLVSKGKRDIFVARLDSAGNVLAALSAGGTGDYEAGHVADVDSAGHTYVLGTYSSAAAFGSTTLPSPGSTTVFVARTNATCTAWSWVTGATGISTEYDEVFAVDSAGNSYLAANVSSSAGATIGGLSISGSDEFLVQLDSSGIGKWAVPVPFYISDIAVDSTGTPILVGTFSGTITLGGTTLSAAASNAVVVARFAPTGKTWQWAVKGEADGYTPYRVAVDGTGDVWVTGTSRTTAQFGSHSLNVTGDQAYFVARLDSTGPTWKWLSGGQEAATGFSPMTGPADISVGPGGNAWITGSFKGTLTLGSQSFTLPGTASQAPFVARFDGGGAITFAAEAATSSRGGGEDVTVNSAGAAHVVGWFNGTANCGSTTLTTPPGSSDDVFVWRPD